MTDTRPIDMPMEPMPTPFERETPADRTALAEHARQQAAKLLKPTALILLLAAVIWFAPATGCCQLVGDVPMGLPAVQAGPQAITISQPVEPPAEVVLPLVLDESPAGEQGSLWDPVEAVLGRLCESGILWLLPAERG